MHRGFIALSILAAGLPALAAPTCNAPQVVVGNNCVLTVNLGWITAGGGTQSLVNVWVPPSATGPVDIEITNMKSNLGDSYSGYLGFLGLQPGDTAPTQLTLADLAPGQPASIGSVSPGSGFQFFITKICWDTTCTAAAPAGAVPNMISMQFTFSSQVTADINPNGIQLVIQFLDANNQVTFEEQEFPSRSDPQYSIVPGVNMGATPASRYVYTTSGALTKPFDVISISNLNNTNAISGTLVLKDWNGDQVAMAPIPSIPANGAAGYLVIGRSAGDTLGLLPSSTVLPDAGDGIFHGVLEVHMTGQTATGFCIVLAQEFNGNSMLNLPVFGSPVP